MLWFILGLAYGLTIGGVAFWVVREHIKYVRLSNKALKERYRSLEQSYARIEQALKDATKDV